MTSIVHLAGRPRKGKRYSMRMKVFWVFRLGEFGFGHS